MPADLLIRGGTLVLPGLFGATADVAVAEGRIERIGHDLEGGAGEEVDARGLHVLPGAVDAHVHFNEPGRTDWEGWATGTRALAAGGTTACVEMPLNAHPPTVDAAAFDRKVEAAERSALVDFALWGGLVPGHLDDMEALAERGVAGFKAFMCDSGIEDFAAADDETLGEGMRRAAALGLPVAVHAERPSELGPPGRTWRDWVAARPPAAEHAAIETALDLAAASGCALHVVHVSTARGVELVAAARARGVDATCETCPHYLELCEDDLETLGVRAKCAPPLRSAAEREALWRRIGDIAFVASDHSPAPPEMKTGDFGAAWGGIAGCQSLLPLLLDSRLAPGTVAALASAHPAQRLRLAKGRLEPGADADLALVDLRVREAPELHDRHGLSPFAGRRVPRVVRTIVRGRTVFRGGTFAEPPHGRLLKPTKGDTR